MRMIQVLILFTPRRPCPMFGDLAGRLHVVFSAVLHAEGERTIQNVDVWATSVEDCWCVDSVLKVVSRRSARLQLSVVFRGESRCNRPPWSVTSLLTGEEFRALAFRRTLYFDLYVRALRAFSAIYQLVFSTLLFAHEREHTLNFGLLTHYYSTTMNHQAESTVRRMSCLESTRSPGATCSRSCCWWTWNAACRRTWAATGCKDASPSGEDNAPPVRAWCVRILRKRTPIE